MDLSYIINHLGEERENWLNAVVPPVFQTSIFSFPDVAGMRKSLRNELSEPFYTRGYNPTVGALRKKLAALEGAGDALVFASGSAAIAAAVMSSVRQGDHVVCVRKPYSWTRALLEEYLPGFGVSASFVDGKEADNFRKAITPATKLIYLESPNTMTFELQDIEAVAAIAREHKITTVVDNSCATPLFQQPLRMGIDMTVHSASKYIGGHSDLVAGVLCGSKERLDRIMATEFMTIGGIISPHDAWLLIRSLRTLPLRMERVASTTEKVIRFLEGHPKIEQVLHPFAAGNLQGILARKQMKNAGGLLSVLLRAKDIKGVEIFCNSLKRFLLACSWGGFESLAFPACALHDSQNYSQSELPWNLVRLYIGLEEPEELVEDLGQALASV